MHHNTASMNFRYASLSICLVLASFISHAQYSERPRALFDSLDVSGGFFSFNMRYTEVMRTNAVLLGFGAGVVVNDNLNVGLAGVFSSSVLKNTMYERFLNDSIGLNTQGGLEMKYGYGGLVIEPVLFHRTPFHIAFPTIIGVGGVNYGYPLPGSDSNDRRSKVAGQAFFALESGLEIEVTLVQHFRIGLGASYLYTTDLDLPETRPDALRTIMYRLSLKLAAP